MEKEKCGSLINFNLVNPFMKNNKQIKLKIIYVQGRFLREDLPLY